MSDNIEWVHVPAPITVTDEPGEFVDSFGSENDGPALAFGDIVVEADSLRDLYRWLDHAAACVAELQHKRSREASADEVKED